MKRSETTTSYRSVVEASQRRPSSTTSCTSGRRRSAAFQAPKWASAAAATSGTISTTVVRSTPSAGPALAVMPVAMPTNATRCGAGCRRSGRRPCRRSFVAAALARRARAADRAQRVGGGELAEGAGRPVAIAERRPEGRQHGAGGEGARARGRRRETDDAEHVLAEPRLHADVGEAVRRADEEPDAADRRCRRAEECAARDHGGRRAAEEQRRQRRASRGREQGDER